MRPGDETQDALAQEVVTTLQEAGIEVAWDDRKKLSPGVKFKDADLVGVPLRIVVGRDAGDRKVEWNPRVGENEVVDVAVAIERAKDAVREALAKR